MIKTTTLIGVSSAILAILMAAIISFGGFGEGVDTANYVRIFAQIHNQTSIWDLRYEPLFVVFVKTFSSRYSSPEFVFLMITVPAILSKVLAVRAVNGNGLVFLFLYMSLWAPTMELNQIRVALATGLFLYVISAHRLNIFVALVLATLTLGFHYSMIGYILTLWVVLLWRNNMFLAQKFLLAFAILTLAYLGFTIVGENLLDRIKIRESIVITQSIRVFGLFSVFTIISTSFVLLYQLRIGINNVPLAVQVVTISAVGGILVFLYQSMHGGLFAYRTLETMTSLLPFSLAWVWRSADRSEWRIAILVLIGIGIAIAPNYWSSRII